MRDNVLVTIILMAYNHAEYVAGAIEGVVNQKTEYSYEIIIHDDCSTDGTDNIIRYYEKEYSDLIIGIYEKENQYSKKIDFITDIIENKARGKYICILECDDAWVRKNKIQKQVSFLERNEDYVACVHNTKILDCLSGNFRLMNTSNKNCDVTAEDILRDDDSSFHYSSIMFRSHALRQYKKYLEIAEFYFGDLPMRLSLLFEGKIFYFKDIMTIYRKNSSPHSWTSQNVGAERKIYEYFLLKKIYKTFDDDTGFRYSDMIEECIKRFDAMIYLSEEEYSKALRIMPDRMKRNIGIYGMIKLSIKAKIPMAMKILRRIRYYKGLTHN